jgi:hypothetical protein
MVTMTLIEGVIDRVNAKGFRLQGESDWRNYSRFADPADILPPNIGDAVAVSVDSQGFVRSVQVVGERTNERASSSVRERTYEATQACNPRPEKDVIVTRLAVLNTATAITSSGGQETDLVTVLALAEELEQWVIR